MRIQVSSPSQGVRPPIISVAKGILKNEHPNAFFRGVSGTVMGQFVFQTIRQGTRDNLYGYLKRKQTIEELPFYQRLGVSVFSGILAGLFGSPFDLAMVRMNADVSKPYVKNKVYKNCFETLGDVWRKEGFFVMWRGYTALVWRGICSNTASLLTYASIKAAVSEEYGSLPAKILVCLFTGAMGALVSHPWDVMKSRVMSMQRDPATGKLPYRGTLDSLDEILRKQGFFGLYRSYWALYFRLTFQAFITWGLKEYFSYLEGWDMT